ncbi:HAE1 family hydrophobic/amphiphilic exporter-1 [Clostridium saccharoperbutylacetonicum]|uniref:Cation/multidrug efflux pump n=3 Tax=Clostridium TaxID=1485 RepID=M1MSS8_9CLOT|nr:efflux RND transporter permease subunit [Clostridium saccharoperbutylacetonicum]AGF57751.1 cation/multidrug efflux pump [Clostridium saccharoperbutylacetonicum N1-4(HMT)]NRT61481.1 HAE1 family hydrophobic/amphiphilic exporter-1 [Clostridium saccharoperbutylacetonicum]NSB24801.1 HAE1 family hydrophobic/amphiphilic exporter-1 [Clostridium saccharoperbutylacetonicum]NSB44173.1 HAE1 family hydrophobic/amphiphilic exporter-1 [Clostridium saccharoperbutylacetonicum]
MRITEISVKRPAAMWMAVILFIGLGIMGYKSMGADLMPSMNIPVISIMTTYNGASAEDVKKDIVKPIEDAVSGISGVDVLNSTSGEGYGTVTITFKMSANINTAYLDVQKAVEVVSARLPKAADKPTLFKMDMSAIPIMIVSINGDSSYEELYNQSDILKQKLEKIPGVGNISLMGADKKQLMIKIDKATMEYYGVNVDALMGALQASNVNIPAGDIKQENLDQAVRIIGQFNSIDAVKNLLVPAGNGVNIRLGDIAKIDLEVPDATVLTRYGGNKTIAMILGKQSDSNVVEVADSVKKELEDIRKSLPKGTEVNILMDTTTFINSSLTQIKHNLIEGIITTAIVLYLFFRSFRSSLVVLIAIPTSLVATFFMMYQMHFTLNMLSLMGLSLVVGTLVDDSIVVIENIQRHMDMGKNPLQAAIDGRKEVGMAAIAITLCDVVVFAPVSLVSGLVGQMFREFGLTIVAATMFSLIVSFTITPMLSSRLLKNQNNDEKIAPKETFLSRINSKFARKSSDKKGSFDKLVEVYRKTLIWSLDNRKKVLAFVIAGVVLSVMLIPMGMIKSEFIPVADQSSFTISLKLAPGSTLKQTDAKVSEVEKYLQGTKEVKDYFSLIGHDGESTADKSIAQIFVNLVPKGERKKSQSELASEIRTFGKKMSGVDLNVAESSSSGGSSKPVSIKIKGNDSSTIRDLSKEVEKLLNTVSGITDISNSTSSRSSELRVNIDNLAATQYKISTSNIGSVVRMALAGTNVGVYRSNNEENDITLKFENGQINSAEDLKSLMITNSAGEEIPLSQVASIQKIDGAPSISREDKQDMVSVEANIQGRVLGEVTDDINSKLKALSIPDGYSISFGGNQKQMADSFSSLGLALCASLALVYMILVVLYESFLTPFIRMMALPCAIIGAFGLLALTGQTLNLMSMIGLIMLEGLASKNGTLLIDYTNTLMKRGMNLREALIESGVTRLRPIIMTSATMIVSMLPVALSMGEGTEMKKSMAIVIIGGMLASTILSPIVLPIIYTLMADLKNKVSFKKKKSHSLEGGSTYEV